MVANARVDLSSDYLEGAHPDVLEHLVCTNEEQTSGYGTDAHCERAQELIRRACDCPEADVTFLMGGTQTNAFIIDAFLAPYQGVIAADTGHIATHEAGAIEFGGHKVLTVLAHAGKLNAEQVEACANGWEQDGTREHTVMPGMVYLSQPTEYGTLYSLVELEAIAKVCDAHGLKLYVDGARLAYGLACSTNDVGLADLARLTDAFYIGGTKCGALFGEAVVIPQGGAIPHLVAQKKQHGALLAKGRLLGVQFESLFEGGDEGVLYRRIGENALRAADALREGLVARGRQLHVPSPTNQVFPIVDESELAPLAERLGYSLWERLGDGRAVIRLATGWATCSADVEAALEALA